MVAPVLSVREAQLELGARTLWSGLSLDVSPGEFIAVLGANGSGKTSLLRTILGEHILTAGNIQLLGDPVRRGDKRIGYIPQNQGFNTAMRVRGREMIGFGIDGHRLGTGLATRSRRTRIEQLLAEVDATPYAREPVELLSGGEQQRLRIAQAIAGDPKLVLCDEPFASLDLRAQRMVGELIDRHRKRLGFAVLFVTHDVNPILGILDKVLYLAGSRFSIGAPEEVLTSATLSELYQAEVDVVHVHGRVIIVGVPDTSHHNHQGET